MTKMPRPERLTSIDAKGVSLAGLKGVTAISPAGEDLGVVDDVVMLNGNVDAVVVEIGGFAGIGSRKVGVKTNTLDLLIDPYDVYYLRLPVSRDALKHGAEAETSSAAVE